MNKNWGKNILRWITLALIAGVAVFSCSKEPFPELPSLVMDDPITELDSIQITARINLKEFSLSRITETGFHWARVGELSMTNVVPMQPVPDNATIAEFTGVWTGLPLDAEYYFQAYIQLDGKDLIHSDIDTASTRDIALSTSFSATGERVASTDEVISTEKVQLFGRLSGLREGVKVQSVGHLWIVRDAAIPADQWNSFDINSADSIRSFEPPSGGQSFDFPDIVYLNPAHYHYIRPFAIYNGVAEYGAAVEIFIGNIWKRIVELPTPLTNAVSFVIGDKAYIVTGARDIGPSLEFDNGSLLQSVIVCDPANSDPAQQFVEDTEPFPGLPRIDAVAFTLNGRGYVGAGRRDTTVLNDFWSYDPSLSEGKWQQVDSMPLHVYDAFSFVLNGKAYVGTGNRGISNTTDFRPTAQVHVFNGIAWEGPISFNSAISNAVSWTIDGTAYVSTGRRISQSAPHLNGSYVFNSGTMSFSSYQPPFAGLARQSAVAFTIDSRIFIGAGTNEVNGVDPVFRDYYVYDFDNTALGWREISNPDAALYCNSTSFSLHGKGYVLGGLRKTSLTNPSTDGQVWEYTPSPKQ